MTKKHFNQQKKYRASIGAKKPGGIPGSKYFILLFSYFFLILESTKLQYRFIYFREPVFKEDERLM